MKYRVLTYEELVTLEKEFIDFLASNTITANDWEKLKANDNTKAEKLIALFSEIIFEKVLSRVKLLEIYAQNIWQFLEFKENEIEMRGIVIENAPDFHIRNIQSKEDFQRIFITYPNSSIKLLKGNRKYTRQREEEVFDWIKRGALISRNTEVYESLREIGD